jgi:uncharacterized protein (DUF362 family)/NAD-dependent dihydropyrimidine dehydrogenase PreA subunit
MNKSQVAVVHCRTYDQDAVAEAVKDGITLLGGIRRFAAAGDRLLLKPNVLVGDSPIRCIGTHPAVVKAVGKLFQEVASDISYGDSPGSGGSESNLRRAEISQAAEEIGLIPADFDSGTETRISDTESVMIAHGALESRGIFSLSKLKSHYYTRMTGAVKNIYGCIPGFWKKHYHVRHPNAFEFCEIPVRLHLLLKPRLHIMDGIMAMEGNGPAGGEPVPMNALLFSTDPVALDAVMCRLVELDPLYVPTSGPGHRLGLGTYLENEIELLGDSIGTLVNGDFQIKRGPIKSFTRQGILTYINNLLAERPVIDESRCSRCGKCVEACPAHPKALTWSGRGRIRREKPPMYRYIHCIRCYCCQEICPQGAISVRRTVLGLP